MNRKAHNSVEYKGRQINHWFILEYIHTKNKKSHYSCRCVCGTIRILPIGRILYGYSKSCGCQNVKNHIKHGKSNKRVYNIWQNMKNRCYNPKSTGYKWYGGRGIKVCESWYNSFDCFYKDMGEPNTDKHSIDRIDNNGNYEPKNCRWATHKEQCKNRRLPQPPKTTNDEK